MADIVTVGMICGLTIILIALLKAGLPVAQASEEVSSHVTTCPLVKPVVAKVGLLVPTLEPLIFHW